MAESSETSNVLTDFERATHALLDSIELGLFKRVKVKSDGTIFKSINTPLESICGVYIRRFDSTRDKLDIKVTLVEKNSTVEKDYKVEDLCDMQGLFLDERDAQKIILQENIERIKRRKQEAEEQVKAREQEIQDLKSKLLDLK